MGKQLGSFVREHREKRGLSQSEVARLLQLKTAQSISNIERGVSPLPKTKIKKLATVLGVPSREITQIVLAEVQDRYAKAAGLKSRSILVSSDLSAADMELLTAVVEKYSSASAAERVVIKRQIRRAFGV